MAALLVGFSLKRVCVCIAGYLLREIKKADIALPEEEVNPVAPLPKHVMGIMVGSQSRFHTHLCAHTLVFSLSLSETPSSGWVGVLKRECVRNTSVLLLFVSLDVFYWLQSCFFKLYIGYRYGLLLSFSLTTCIVFFSLFLDLLRFLSCLLISFLTFSFLAFSFLHLSSLFHLSFSFFLHHFSFFHTSFFLPCSVTFPFFCLLAFSFSFFHISSSFLVQSFFMPYVIFFLPSLFLLSSYFLYSLSFSFLYFLFLTPFFFLAPSLLFFLHFFLTLLFASFFLRAEFFFLFFPCVVICQSLRRVCVFSGAASAVGAGAHGSHEEQREAAEESSGTDRVFTHAAHHTQLRPPHRRGVS